MALSSELCDALHQRVESCYQQAEQFYLKAFPRPEIRVNLRGRAAGVAEAGRNRLRFNALLYQENPEAFLDQVIPHEVAHLITWQICGRRVRPHGREWQQVMTQVFALEAKRTHAFDVQRAAKENYLYQCGCPDRIHRLTIRRHRRVEKGQGYLCLACQSPLRFFRESSG